MAAGISVKLSLDSSQFIRNAKSALATGKALVSQFARNPIKFTAVGSFLAAEKAARFAASKIKATLHGAANFGKGFASTIVGGIPGVGLAMSLLEGGMTAVGAAVAQTSREFTTGVKDAYNYGSEMQDMHDRTGIAVEKLVVLTQAMKDNGIEAEALIPAISKMNAKLIEAAKGGSDSAFEQIGLHVKDLIDLDAGEQILKIGSAVSKLDNAAAKSTALKDIFGKTGPNFLSLFGDSKAMETAALSVGKQAQLLGKNAEVFDRISDRLGRVGVKLRGFFVGVAANLAPVIDKLSANFDKMDFSEWGQKLGDKIKDALAWLVAWWNEPDRVTGYFWEYSKAQALALGNILVDVADKFAEALKSSLSDSMPSWLMSLGEKFSTGMGMIAAGPNGQDDFEFKRSRELAGIGAMRNAGEDHMGAAAQFEKAAQMRPTDAFQRARIAIGDVASSAKVNAPTPWNMKGFSSLLGLPRIGSLAGASMTGALDRYKQLHASPGEMDTMRLSGMHAGAYGQSPALSATAARRISRAHETEAQIRERHRLGSFAGGDAARLRKMARDKEANALKSDTEYLNDIATTNRTIAKELTGKK